MVRTLTHKIASSPSKVASYTYLAGSPIILKVVFHHR